MSEKKTCAIVTAVYKKQLNQLEELSMKNCVDVFKNRDIFLMVPEDLDVSYYHSTFGYEFKVIRVNPNYFRGWQAYNWFLKTLDFYLPFEDKYEYICVDQQDVWRFEDKLDYFMDMNYDYYGGPITAGCWNDREMVGNGGFSLRKVKSFIEAIKKNYKEKDKFVPEDLYFCCNSEMSRNLTFCPVEIALQFAFSADRAETYEFWYKRTNGVLPMAVHNFYKYDALEFWHRFL